jgi:hypothetical protein
MIKNGVHSIRTKNPLQLIAFRNAIICEQLNIPLPPCDCFDLENENCKWTQSMQNCYDNNSLAKIFKQKYEKAQSELLITQTMYDTLINNIQNIHNIMMSEREKESRSIMIYRLMIHVFAGVVGGAVGFAIPYAFYCYIS